MQTSEQWPQILCASINLEYRKTYVITVGAATLVLLGQQPAPMLPLFFFHLAYTHFSGSKAVGKWSYSLNASEKEARVLWYLTVEYGCLLFLIPCDLPRSVSWQRAVVLHVVAQCSYARGLLDSRCSVCLLFFRLLSAHLWAKENRFTKKKESDCNWEIDVVCGVFKIEYAL